MKKNNFIKSLLFCMMLFVGFAVTGMKAECAETQIWPGTSIGSAPTMQLGQEYWAETNGLGWVSFVTPSQGGYIEVEYKNINIDTSADVTVCTASGAQLDDGSAYPGSSKFLKFRSEPGKRNGASMEPNTRYYVRVGEKPFYGTEYPGNVKITVRYKQDNNPDGKAYAQDIQFNAQYTASIDGCVDDGWDAVEKDNDYFKFTATSSGAHRFKITNAARSGSLNYSVHKWNSGELVKQVKGSDMKDFTYNGNTEEYDIILEAGQTYYLHVLSAYVGEYTFSFSNQCVKSISMNATLNMKPNDTFKLNPTVSPATAYNKTLKFTSSDSNVAYVNSSTGEIKAYRAGKTVITATATDGSNVSARCTVYVSPSKPSGLYWTTSSTSAIKMHWNSVSGASGYTVYKWTGKKWSAIKNTSATSYTVKKLKSGTGYKFRVRAYVNADGKRYSSYSDTGYFATEPKKTSISSISKLKKKKSGIGYYYRATVRWKKSSGANRYKLYYRVPGSSYKYYVGTYKGTKATVSLYHSKYSSGSKTRTFYVVPVRNYGGRDYAGSYSKGKSYKFR